MPKPQPGVPERGRPFLCPLHVPVLALQPSQPETVPVLAVQDLEEQAAPFDLGTQDKYRNGQKVTLEGFDYGQWYYVYLNKKSYRIGWIFPTTDNTV
ncbi:hypothetical protein [Pseudarthrobacter raffinosi]|uniref:hypothetical protein n=1 Tax=Pseudarthrobacter raffinosi TaxID=2953651 RepID=UPI0027E31B3C|nr:hypothetical protein [Pseudarthrobacter sp. MDT3-9]